MDHLQAGQIADHLIANEVAVQDRMWGQANERGDSKGNQLLDAAMAQLVLTKLLADGATEEQAVAEALAFYPKGWEGLRSYGSIAANLAVAGAFVRSEAKRRIAEDEDYTRTQRGQPYTIAKPYVSSDQAIGELTREAEAEGRPYTGL